MAAYDIKKHFSGLRVQTARRKDPFATGFEDDSDEDRKSRSKNRTKNAGNNVKPTPPKTNIPVSTAASPFAHIDALRIDSDDDFLDLPAQKRTDRRPSPAPSKFVADGQARRGSLPGINSSKKAAVLAAGQLAYLDDSDDDEALPVRRSDRRPSPAPRKGSDESNGDRSRTPLGGDKGGRKDNNTAVVSKHTVASPFAGTKYLQDSDSDEEAVSSRKNSAEDVTGEQRPKSKHLEVKRVDKPNKNGSGVSWRAFSAGRAEQRFAEVEALQASLKQRGRAISFCPHATTDDGERVPVVETPERAFLGAPGGARGRKQGRTKSPPRRAADVKPTEDEMVDGQQPNGGAVGMYDPVQYKTNPFTATATTNRTTSSNNLQSPPMASLTSASTMLSGNDPVPPTPVSPTNISTLSDSIESIAAKLTVSPQTIPESATVDHSLNSPLTSPIDYDPISRNTSTRSLRMGRQTRTSTSRRPSRRSTNTSVSPAHAFLSSWGKAENEEATAEPKPDDEGQSIGVDNKYVIGRTINHGGFGVVKEVHSLEDGGTVIQAVKIVRKSIDNASEAENDKLQQEMEHEVSIWRHLEHRHILKLHAVYDTDFATFCVMDLNVGGTLFDLVRKARQSSAQNNGRKGLPPHLAKSYAYQLACALRYLHEDIRVCHRDVKLENCLIDLTGPNADSESGNLRLCDFGLADFLHGESIDEGIAGRYSEQLSLSGELPPIPTGSSVIGTLEYASPKGLSVNRKLFETAGDVWAFGVIVYALCTGDLPFRHPMPSKTAELILRADWDETALRDAAAGSDEVIDLVKGCLEKEIDMRYTIGDALRSPWFEGCREETEETVTNGWR